MVVFENVLSHTSTQKSPKYVNLHKLFAEFYLGFFVCQDELGLEAGWNEISGGWLLVCAIAVHDSASSQPKGPLPRCVLFGARGSDLSVVTSCLLVTSAHPYFLNKPQICQACAQWSSLLRAVEADTVCTLQLHVQVPVVACVDAPKPSGLHSFCCVPFGKYSPFILLLFFSFSLAVSSK